MQTAGIQEVATRLLSTSWGRWDTLVQWDLSEPSEEPLNAGEYDGCLAFTDEETEAQRLGDLLKMMVLVFDTGDHAVVTFRLLCLCATEQAARQPELQPSQPSGVCVKSKRVTLTEPRCAHLAQNGPALSLVG